MTYYKMLVEGNKVVTKMLVPSHKFAHPSCCYNLLQKTEKKAYDIRVTKLIKRFVETRCFKS